MHAHLCTLVALQTLTSAWQPGDLLPELLLPYALAPHGDMVSARAPECVFTRELLDVSCSMLSPHGGTGMISAREHQNVFPRAVCTRNGVLASLSSCTRVQQRHCLLLHRPHLVSEDLSFSTSDSIRRRHRLLDVRRL